MALRSLRLQRFTSQCQYIGIKGEGLPYITEMLQSSKPQKPLIPECSRIPLEVNKE